MRITMGVAFENVPPWPGIRSGALTLLVLNLCSSLLAASPDVVRVEVRFDRDGKNVNAICRIVNDGDTPVGVGYVDMSWCVESHGNITSGRNDHCEELYSPNLFTLLRPLPRVIR